MPRSAESERGPSIAEFRGVTPSGRAVSGPGTGTGALRASRADSELGASNERIRPRPSGGTMVVMEVAAAGAGGCWPPPSSVSTTSGGGGEVVSQRRRTRLGEAPMRRGT